MRILLVELNINEVSIDEYLFPNKEQNLFIYEHLRHYCSKFYPLPAITIKVCSLGFFVIRGHHYISIAKELGHQKIRAIVDKSSALETIQNFLLLKSVIQLDWEVVRKEESETLVDYFWYILFFEKPLNQQQQIAFESEIVDFFRQIKLPNWAKKNENRIINLSYPYSGSCAEFQAYTPIEDERWHASSRSVLINFHLKHVPIISFQGRRFKVEAYS